MILGGYLTINHYLNFKGFIPLPGFEISLAFTEYFTTPAEEFPPVKKQELGHPIGI